MALKRATPALLLLLSFLAGTAVAASTVHMERYAIAGGGGQASGGGYTLDFTLGQPMAGGVSGGGFELCAGYWCGGASPAAPQYGVYLPLVMRDW